MERIKDIYKALIMVFSEIIWIYYLIVIFTSVEWQEPVFFDITWLVVAGIMGYALNTLLARKSNHVLVFSGNLVLLGVIIIQNWRGVVPDGVWGFGLALSIALSFIFVRSARLVYRQPTRGDLLRRFEGNIIFYIIFALIITGNKWSNSIFHLIFMFAIASSLLGMILTLQNDESSEGKENTKIMKVGQSGWFVGLITCLMIGVLLSSLTLLLPSVNRALYTFVIGAWEGLKWLALNMGSFLMWLFSFLPYSPMEPMPAGPAAQIIVPQDAGKEASAYISYIWMIIAAFLLIILAIWFFTKLIINRKLPKSLKIKQITVTREAWWLILSRKLKAYLYYLKIKWRMRFPYYYFHPIYWYYNQVLRWGTKNGLAKAKSETSQEYLNKIIEQIPQEENNFTYQGQVYQLSQLLRKLNKDYQATYYGLGTKMSEETEYKLLLNHLRKVSIKDKNIRMKEQKGLQEYVNKNPAKQGS